MYSDHMTFSATLRAAAPLCIALACATAFVAPRMALRFGGITDAALLLPIRLGDHVTAHGAFEVVDGVRIFSAHSLVDETSPVAPGR